MPAAARGDREVGGRGNPGCTRSHFAAPRASTGGMTSPAEHPEALALRELVWVRSLARRLVGDPGLADDIAQDAWLEARTAPPARIDGGLRGWLATVVHHRVQRLRRGERRRRVREANVADATATTSDADVVERAAMHRELVTVVMELDEPLRSAVLLRYLDGLSTEEVAARQGIAAAAARKRLSRALAVLRQRLDRRHAGGFAAWSATWQAQLGLAPAGGGSFLAWCVVTLMQVKWWVVSAALVVFAAWAWWPRPAPDVATVAGRDAVPAPATAANESEPLPIATERTAIGGGLVEVVDEFGGPRGGVLLLGLADGALRQHFTTDARGQVEPPAIEADEWLCAVPGHVPLRVPRTTTPSQRITYPVGATVAGVATTPVGSTAPIVLRVEHDRPPSWAQGLDAAALAAVAALGIDERMLRLPLDGGTHFRFGGLRGDWSGALSIAGGWTLRETSRQGHADGATNLLLLEPAADLRLLLGEPFVVRGRLLAAGVPTAGLDVYVLAPDLPPGSAPPQARSDGEGRFVVPVPRAEPTAPWRGDLLVSLVGDDLAQRRVEAEAGRTQIDVGDVDVGRAIAFRIRAADGAALAGADVHVIGTGRAIASATSDADGLARVFGVPVDAAWATVRAHGHRMARVALPPTGDVAVQLDRGNGIDVNVRTRRAEPVVDLRVRVEAERLPFDAGGGFVPSQPFVQAFPLAADGRLELGDLVPGLLLQLVAVDDAGQELGRTSVITPAIGRVDRVELVIDANAFHVVGAVHDADGRPITRARVHVEQDGVALQARSDGDGRFRLGPLRAPLGAAHVEVTHPAFVPWLQEAAVLGAGARLDVVLERGRTVRALLRQPDGAPLPDGKVEAWITFDGAASALGRSAPAGELWFERVAMRAGRLTVRFGGREWHRPITATDTHVEVLVPAPGQLHASCDRTQVDRGERIALVVTPLEPAGDVVRQYFPANADPTSPDLVLLLAAGRYRVAGEARRLGGGRHRVREFGAPREIEVRVGDVLRVSLP